MNRNTPILAGSAVALLMASVSAFAMTSVERGGSSRSMLHGGQPNGAIILVQADDAAPVGVLPEAEAPKEEPQPQAAPAEEPQPEAAPAEPEPQAAEPEKEPASEAPPVEAEPQPAEPAPEPAVEPKAEPEPAPQSEQAQPEATPEQPDAEQPAVQPEPAPEKPAVEQPAPEAPTTEPAAPAAEPEAPAEAAPPAPVQAPEVQAEPAPDTKTPQPAPAAPAEGEAPALTPAPAPEGGAVPEAPATEQPAQATPPSEAPVTTEVPNDGSQAPMLDSQKQAPPPVAAPADGGQAAQPPTQPPVAEVPAGPPPESDQAAQQLQTPVTVAPVAEEKGVRVERAADAPNRRERPRGSEVLREFDDRVIIQFNNQVIVESNDRPRMSRGARDVYYEDLPRGRTRETIERPDGTRVVTVRNEYGDIIRRSRITPDDREYVLSYVDEEAYDSRDDWRDPGLDLPPMRLDIPEDEYIFNVEADSTPDTYYDFLDQPPVEQVERLYSIDEVKRSARVRDKTRRVDLDTLTFEFGAATIPEDQVQRLASVASAMETMLAKNPAETFLIEGHTDAVGSDLANLALSDRRAEAVADALTNVFAIPPENLATQGYGEQYLKIRSQEQQRENRRVAIRRITPLVTPVAAAQ